MSGITRAYHYKEEAWQLFNYPSYSAGTWSQSFTAYANSAVSLLTAPNDKCSVSQYLARFVGHETDESQPWEIIGEHGVNSLSSDWDVPHSENCVDECLQSSEDIDNVWQSSINNLHARRRPHHVSYGYISSVYEDSIEQFIPAVGYDECFSASGLMIHTYNELAAGQIDFYYLPVTVFVRRQIAVRKQMLSRIPRYNNTEGA